MAGESKTTTDHDKIREWAEQRDGRPATVEETADGGAGVLVINFPGGAEEGLQDISWDEWFAKFDDKDLAFIYQDEKAGGEGSTFYKLVERSNA